MPQGPQDPRHVAAALNLADPFAGSARTPGAIPAQEWLAMPAHQACLEVGLDAAMYPRVRRDIEGLVTAYLNRKSQGQLDPEEGAPMVGRSTKSRRLAPLLQGGTLTRIGSPPKR